MEFNLLKDNFKFFFKCLPEIKVTFLEKSAVQQFCQALKGYGCTSRLVPAPVYTGAFIMSRSIKQFQMKILNYILVSQSMLSFFNLPENYFRSFIKEIMLRPTYIC